MDGARLHDLRGTDPVGEAENGRYRRRSTPGMTRIVAAVAALPVVMVIVTMTNVLPILASATAVDHGQSGAAPPHSRMRF